MFYRQKHLLAIEGLTPPEIGHLLELADSYVVLERGSVLARGRGANMEIDGVRDLVAI